MGGSKKKTEKDCGGVYLKCLRTQNSLFIDRSFIFVEG